MAKKIVTKPLVTSKECYPFEQVEKDLKDATEQDVYSLCLVHGIPSDGCKNKEELVERVINFLKELHG